MRKEILITTIVSAIFLASCGGSTVKIISSPLGAKVTFENQTEVTPFTRYGVKQGTYDITGIKTGYLPQKMTIDVGEGENIFSMVFAREAERPVEFASNVPDDGVRIRTNPDALKYEFLPYDPVTGKTGKIISIDGPSEPLFDLKLLRKTGGIENSNFLVKIINGKKACWVDAQPGGDSVSGMAEVGSASRPNWSFPAKMIEDIKRTDPEIKDGVATMTISGVKVGQCKSGRVYQAQTNGNLSVWSAISDEGVQDLYMVEDGGVKQLWHGEYGIGALDYLKTTSSVASTSGDFIFATLATEDGYRVSALDKTGRIIDSEKVFDFSNDITIKRFQGFFGVVLTNRKGVVTTYTFDGKKFMDMPDVINADFKKTSGVWLKIGNNLELYFNDKLSAMCVPSGARYKVIFAGSRF